MIDLNEYELKMDKAIDVLKREFTGLRTGRASVSLLDSIFVDSYGSSKVQFNDGEIAEKIKNMDFNTVQQMQGN